MDIQKTAILINHYESHSAYSGETRYSGWAKRLITEGYCVYLICSSVLHSQNIDILGRSEKYRIIKDNGINYVYVKTSKYDSNSGKDRINNLFKFYFGVKQILPILPKPDFIIARSPNPLACVIGIKYAKKIQVPCICDIVDLWPESIVVYKKMSKTNPIIRLLYSGEKWIYKNCNALIFSTPGAYDYILEHRWESVVPKEKVFYINMGIDLKINDINRDKYSYEDPVFSREDLYKVVYSGSVRLVNNLKLLCDAGKIIQDKGIDQIFIMIHGAGDQVDELKQYCKNENIHNVKLYGRIQKQQIPYVLSHSDLCILCYQNTPLLRFGGSMNKMFDYFASGKPIITNAKMGHSIIEEYNCGVELNTNDPEQLAEEIVRFYSMTSCERAELGANSRRAAEDYDIQLLSSEFLRIVKLTEENFKLKYSDNLTV